MTHFFALTDCMANLDSELKKKCMLPFTHGGEVYHQCKPENGSYWCSTLLDGEGRHVEGYFEHCSDACQVGLRFDGSPEASEWNPGNIDKKNFTFCR